MEISPELKKRQEEFDEWVRDVRDPASANTEGIRRIDVDGAKAHYQIAPLADTRFAIQCDIEYRCGNCSGSGYPWIALETREACINLFLERARKHFGGDFHPADSVVSEKQRRARNAMLQKLESGLFGFIEPEPGK